MRITNVTDSAFSVSWVSDAVETGHVLYGASPSSVASRADDDRGAGVSGTTHHVTVTGLAAQTAYYVDAYSGAVVDNNGGAHYRVNTGSSSSPGQPSAVYGQVARASGASPAGLLVYLVLADGDGKGSTGAASPLSCIVKPGDQGYWVLNLGNARLGDLSGPFAYSPSGDRLELTLLGGPDESLVATLDSSAAAPARLLTVPAPAPSATLTPPPATWTPTRTPASAPTSTPVAPTPTSTSSAVGPTMPPTPPAATSTPTPALTATQQPASAPTAVLTQAPSATVAPGVPLSTTVPPAASPASVTPVLAPTATPSPSTTVTPGPTRTPAPAQPDPLAIVGGVLVVVALAGLAAVGLVKRRR